MRQCPSFCCLGVAEEAVGWVRAHIRCNRSNYSRILRHLPTVQVVDNRLNYDKNNLCCNDRDSLSFLKKCIAECNKTGSRHWMLTNATKKGNH